jgi:hypothetical protein
MEEEHANGSSDEKLTMEESEDSEHADQGQMIDGDAYDEMSHSKTSGPEQISQCHA